ncbi:MAG: hypothetical protein V7L31_13080 [Nostoc sp.]|uniref:hypothetical protein n=1 Tax=Nostoc sp. TaxID=1180 RepID=UPI002FF104B2
MKSVEFRVLLAVAGRLASAELIPRSQAGQKPKCESSKYSSPHSALSTEYGK